MRSIGFNPACFPKKRDLCRFSVFKGGIIPRGCLSRDSQAKASVLFISVLEKSVLSTYYICVRDAFCGCGVWVVWLGA